MSLQKKINKFFIINIETFALKRSVQEELLSQFPVPENLFDRSYYQFRIQFQLLSFQRKLTNNFIGILAIPIIIIKGILNPKNNNKLKSEKKTAVFPYKDLNYHNALPNEILEEFRVESINFQSGIAVKRKDFKFILKLILKFFYAPYFLSKCIYKILFYRYIINNFNPDAIISSAEYSFTSSVATAYCEDNGIEHINIMHGEKLFYLRDSFFQFSRFYIWDEFYKNLFVKLKAAPNQFIVGNFPALKFAVKKQDSKKFSYTYYLAAEDEATLYKIKSSMLLLDAISKLNIRFHPRYSSINQVQQIFNGFNIENSREVTLETSFNSTEHVISLYSSILLQAHFFGLKIVIDDVNQENFEKLKEADYIMFSKPHQLLSTLLK